MQPILSGSYRKGVAVKPYRAIDVLRQPEIRLNPGDSVLPLDTEAFTRNLVILCVILFIAYHIRIKKKDEPKVLRILLRPFASPDTYTSVVGDLEESYHRISAVRRTRAAALWYARQIILSLRPILWAWVKRISGVLALIEAWRRMRS